MTYEQIELISSACRRAVSDVLIENDLPVDPAELPRLIVPLKVRNFIIRSEYNQGRAAGIKSEALLVEIADRFYISYETVYSITHKRR